MRAKPYISVIITAFNRRDYVIDAFNSALNQDFDRDSYEIIFANNFDEAFFADYCVRNDILDIKCSASAMGEMLCCAISAAKGDVLCFLDDDDLFDGKKLSRVANIFTSDDSLIYYHNDGIYVDAHRNYIRDLNERNLADVAEICLTDETKDIHYREFLEHVHRFGSSCISVRKSFLEVFLDKLRLVRISPDIFITLCALIASGAICSDSNKLTSYRVSDKQWSNYRKNTTEEGIRLMCLRAADSAYGYGILRELAIESGGTEVKRYIVSLLLARQISCAILDKHGSRKPIILTWIKFFRHSGDAGRLKLYLERATVLSFLSTVAYLVHPSIARVLFLRLTPTI